MDDGAPYRKEVFHQRAESPLRLEGTEAVRRFFAGCFATCDPHREYLFVAHLDRGSRCVHLTCHDGDKGGAQFPMRDVILDAVRHGSAALIVAHNHPSGDPTPSATDYTFTRRLALVFEAAGISIFDHVILGEKSWFSFRAAGLI